jgi:proprotein convertase subtilisin/kexin type 5
LSICRKCSEFCKTCDDFATCKTCIPNYSLANNKCYPPRSCPEGYTYNGNDCTKCPINCASCVSDTQCNYCMETFYLDTNTKQCVSTCPIGYYADVESRVCMVCAPQCKTCVNNNYTCTSCKDLVDGGVTTFTYLFGSACVDRCPYL